MRRVSNPAGSTTARRGWTWPPCPSNLEVSTYEGGVKSELFDRRLRANLAVFYNDYKNLQVSFYDPVYVGSRRGNAGQAHSYGVELETDAAFTDAFHAQFSAGYLFAVYDEYKGAGGAGINADGNRLTNSPRWNLSGGIHLGGPGADSGLAEAQHQRPVPDPDLHQRNASCRRPNVVPAQTFLNAVATWTAPDPHWQVVFSGRNLLDSDKPVSSTYTPSTSVYYLNFPDPRTWLVTLRYEL